MRHTNDTHDRQLTAVTVRLAGPADRSAVERLAVLDSASVPAGDVLLAEVDHEVQAALPVNGGEAIADPFRPTVGLVALLRERAHQISGPAHEHSRFGLRLRAA
jgi:hypothetical protein